MNLTLRRVLSSLFLVTLCLNAQEAYAQNSKAGSSHRKRPRVELKAKPQFTHADEVIHMKDGSVVECKETYTDFICRTYKVQSQAPRKGDTLANTGN